MPSLRFHLLLLTLLITRETWSMMSCSYGSRGSLTSTCINAVPSYFRTTNYRFDNLDETVRCVSCNLSTLESNTFDISGNQIKNLDLTASSIVTLKPKSFIGLVFLQKLIVSQNLINAVPAGTFMGITKVQQLYLDNNKIAMLGQYGFRELTNLATLKLNNNEVGAVEVAAFEGLGSLQDLDLSNNQILHVDDVFGGLNSILTINLANNKISDINVSNPLILSTLLELNLANNQFRLLPKDRFLSLNHLQTLDLSSNPIETIEPGAFRGMYDLEELRLRGCQIMSLESGVMKSLHLLRMLDLSQNRITNYKSGLFSGLPELRQLNLSHNSIMSLERTGVFALHSLNTLDISFNRIVDIDYKDLVDHTPRLAHFQLNGNQLPCYLAKEMRDYFREDGLVFTLGEKFDSPNLICNDSRADKKEHPSVSNGEEEQEVAGAQIQQAESSGHETILYLLTCVSLASVVCLFYLQYRNQKDIRDLIGRSNCSEEHLISSNDLQARDDF